MSVSSWGVGQLVITCHLCHAGSDSPAGQRHTDKATSTGTERRKSCVLTLPLFSWLCPEWLSPLLTLFCYLLRGLTVKAAFYQLSTCQASLHWGLWGPRGWHCCHPAQ